MPIDASVYSQIQPPRFNSPFENLATVMQLRAQQENMRGLKEQREAIAEQRRAQTERIRRDNEEAAQVRALFSRTDPATGQPQPPTREELSGVIDPERATKIFDGFEALIAKAGENRDKDRQRIASIAGGVLAWPEADRPRVYQDVIQKMVADGDIREGDVPKVYSEPWVRQIQRAALSPKDQIEQDKPLEVTAGASLMSPAGQVIGTAPGGGGSDKPASVKEYEYARTQGFKGSFKDYQDEDANRKQRAATERAPYFTYQPVFDPQGRPISAIRFDARGGPPVNVDVSALTGGGQLKPPPGTTGQQSIADEVSTVQLDRLKVMFDEGGKRFVGPLAGRWEDIRQRTPGFKVNKTYANFKAATDAFKNSVIKAVTGAAMSEPEAKRIIGQIPTEIDKPDVWIAKAEQTRKNLADLQGVIAKKSSSAPSTAPPAGETPEQRIKRLLGGG